GLSPPIRAFTAGPPCGGEAWRLRLACLIACHTRQRSSHSVTRSLSSTCPCRQRCAAPPSHCPLSAPVRPAEPLSCPARLQPCPAHARACAWHTATPAPMPCAGAHCCAMRWPRPAPAPCARALVRPHALPSGHGALCAPAPVWGALGPHGRGAPGVGVSSRVRPPSAGCADV